MLWASQWIPEVLSVFSPSFTLYERLSGHLSIFLLKVSSCIYKRTRYGERLKAFHRSDIRHTCIYKCAMVKRADYDSKCDIFSLTAQLEIDLLKFYVSRNNETGSLPFRKPVRNTEKSWIIFSSFFFFFKQAYLLAL